MLEVEVEVEEGGCWIANSEVQQEDAPEVRCRRKVSRCSWVKGNAKKAANSGH